jgi:hypothetical protein
MIGFIFGFIVVIMVVVLASVRRSSQISREEEEDDSFDFGALEGDLRNHVAKINAETANV